MGSGGSRDVVNEAPLPPLHDQVALLDQCSQHPDRQLGNLLESLPDAIQKGSAFFHIKKDAPTLVKGGQDLAGFL